MRMIADRNLTFHTYDQATAATFMGRYQQADPSL